MNPYLADIFAQPTVLRTAVNAFDSSTIYPLKQRLDKGEFDRVVITGMGASYFASHPAYLALTQLPIPVLLVNAAELNHYSCGLVTERTLLWMCSQSGRSAELIRLLDQVQENKPGAVLRVVNDPESPMAKGSDFCQLINAGEENSVSTKTYMNMLAINILIAQTLLGENVNEAKAELLSAADEIEAWLVDWEIHKKQLDGLLGDFKDMFILGRGLSMAAVWGGALVNKEAAKCAIEGMHSADFRHGPMELCAPGLTALVFAGIDQTAAMNTETVKDITKYKGNAIYITRKGQVGLNQILLPDVDDLALPLVEILPMQLLSVVMAERKGIEPGKFRHVGKVTTKE